MHHKDRCIYLVPFGATTTLSVPACGGFGPPALAAIIPNESPKALVSTVHGVFTHGLPSRRFSDDSISSSVISGATTVTPEGWPPTSIDEIASGLLVGGIGRLPLTCQPAASIASAISWANSKLSASSRKYKTSVGAEGCPFKAVIKSSRLRVRGATFFRICSSFSSASLARALAIAASFSS